MAENKDRLYTQRRQAEEQINKLLEERNRLENEYANIADKRTKPALSILKDAKEIEQEIQNLKLDQLQTSKKIDEIDRERTKKEQLLEGIEGKIANSRKKTRDISKDILKVITKGAGKLVQSLGIDEKAVARRKEINDQTIKLLSNEDQRSKLKADEIQELESTIKLNNAIGDIEKEILTELETGGVSQMNQQDVINSLKEKGLDVSKLTADQITFMEKQAKRIAGATELMDENFQKAYSEVAQITSGLDDMISKAETFGAILTNSKLTSLALRGAVLGVAGAFAKDVFDSAKEVRQELGLSVADSAKFGFQITRNAKLLGILGGNAEEVKNFSVEIANEFGNIGNLTDDVLKQFVDLSAATGLTGQNAAKLANSIMSIQGGTLETSLNTIKVFENLARAEGVSSKIILEDLAEDADKFAEFAKDGGKNLAEAAIAARKLGMNLSTVAGIADKLLEFETSIENQMQAQVLLGRSINLDKARELALSGNLKGLAEEVKNQVGSQAEFEAMNVIQRRALAEALGTNVADLGRMVRGEDTSAQLAEKRAAAEEKRGETQMQIMKTMEGMMGLMALMQGVSAAMLLIEQLKTFEYGKQSVLNVKNAFLEAKKAKSSTAGALAAAAKAVFSNPLLALGSLAVLGGVIAGVNALMKPKESIEDGFVDSEGNVISTPKGSINIDSDDDMIVGSNLFGGGGNQTSQQNVKVDFTALESTSAAQLKETKEMNQTNKKLLRQNEALMRELITKTGNSSLANTI